MSRKVVNKIIRLHSDGFPHRMHLGLCVLTVGVWLPFYLLSFVAMKIYDKTHGL